MGTNPLISSVMVDGKLQVFCTTSDGRNALSLISFIVGETPRS